MINVDNLSIGQILGGYKNKNWSVTDITRSYLARIDKLDGKIRAFLTIIHEDALKDAQNMDQILTRNPDVLKTQHLFGIPYGAKDLFSTRGVRTTAGSKIIGNYIPPYDATAIKKIKNAGGILLGKLNQDAWGHGTSGEHSDYFPTHNPWGLEYVSGGSSSGSGAAVAARMISFATGTDTAGSTRCPASFCNVTGMKPTYGRVSRYGIIAMASSLDSIGHITVNVEDAARVLRVTAGHDELDATTPKVAVPNYLELLKSQSKKIRVGIPKEYLDGVVPEVRTQIENALKKLKELGFAVIEVSLTHTQLALPVYYIVQPAEVSSNLARYDGVRFGHPRETFGDEAKRRIMLGTYILSAGYYDAYYRKAMQVRTLICRDFEEAFQKVDVLIGPVMPHCAFKIGEKVSDPLLLYLEDVFTAPMNLAGIPSLAIPCGFGENGLPIGMQIIGPQFSESLLFQIGHAYQQATDFHKKLPPIINSI
jgi:aspartyl-tRNA(Asn)/glutamyl-tRNA(Gln) amidotransferase subunit A